MDLSRPDATSAQAAAQPQQRQVLDGANQRTSRRGALRTMTRITATAVGAAALVEVRPSTTEADARSLSSNDFTSPAITVTATNGATGITVTDDTGTAISATNTGTAPVIRVLSSTGNGIYSQSIASVGVVGTSSTSVGVAGTSGSGDAVRGDSTNGNGVVAISQNGIGVIANGGTVGVDAASAKVTGTGVGATGGVRGIGVNGFSQAGIGVRGDSPAGIGGAFGGGRAALRLYPSPAIGHPSAGFHDRGEITMDAAASLWICIAPGIPGIWKRAALRQCGLCMAMEYRHPGQCIRSECVRPIDGSGAGDRIHL